MNAADHRKDTFLHFGVAEQGKVYALEGQHEMALWHYREAMQMAKEKKAPDIFFHHYVICSLESLEHMEAYQEVADYCQMVIQGYQSKSELSSIEELDLANNYQRYGVVKLKSGNVEEAQAAFAKVLKLANFPLTERLLQWIRRGLRLTNERIAQEQREFRFFDVIEVNVSRNRAIKIPCNMIPNPKDHRRGSNV